MSFQLRGPYREWSTSNSRWESYLNLALKTGWQPSGTLAPLFLELLEDGTGVALPAEDWEGGYLSNNLQTVSDQDAAAMAEALERWLAQAPLTPLEEVERYLAWRAPTWDGVVVKLPSAVARQLTCTDQRIEAIERELSFPIGGLPVHGVRRRGLEGQREMLREERKALIGRYDPDRVLFEEWIDALTEDERELLELRAFIIFLREGSFSLH